MAGELVVCYDGSEGAHAALAEAIMLSRALDATLVIAYGYEVSRFGGEVKDLAAALHEQGDRLTSEGVATATDAGVAARPAVLSGPPAAVIAEFAAAEGAAMIVCGTRSERPLTGVLVGSVTHKLLQLATVPMLAVPHKD